ncbi:hypothetical protein [Nonomuraea sediminis]|uniref:hypothetical protein n=1 Tax=Nonomuraea sediminis TaxID=2835864 RepID=UPI001BDDA55F|nr:hypothetical protein [Nonomuraea sediminis]
MGEVVHRQPVRHVRCPAIHACPDLPGLSDAVDQPTVAEIVALGPGGRPSFEVLRHRTHVRDTRRIAALIEQHWTHVRDTRRIAALAEQHPPP